MEKQVHSDDPKDAFQCKIEDGKQNFSSEVLGNVHSKKHDLSLNLEMPLKGPGGLFADQTPTPTRLIGKCEEVGLFEDLQKVNPFDETFRRAVESGTNNEPSFTTELSRVETDVSAISCRLGEGETLHTPHIFPSNINRVSHDAVSAIKSSVVKQRSRIKTNKVSSRNKQNMEMVSAFKSIIPTPLNSEKRNFRRTISTKRKTPAVVEILPKPPVRVPPIVDDSIPLVIIPSGSMDKTLALDSMSSSVDLAPALVKEKLKEHLIKVRDNGQAANKIPAFKKRSKNAMESRENSNKIPKTNELSKIVDNQADQKHERWKAAAKRYRVRMKESQDQLHKRNIELEDENLRLHTELAELKHVHRNCSVSRERRNAPVTVQSTSPGIANTVSGALESMSIEAQQQTAALLLNSIEQQQQLNAISSPQQHLITSHIIDSHSINRMPIFIVIGPTAGSVGPAVSESSECALGRSIPNA
ncbi:cyclic AMP-dependent transcription factor ATF-7 [Anopheles nili]|uniref:cyclic AMP-dependent transcription factor ATF-7 n=1 Tax=Anopheles nili TaxID=185578 RepID=UPI00237BBC75|nr:cyclic AMP-dependent transcription factor ATF-7 [Anopheles nili]